MAPTVLRHTPHDADLLDRTGILAASQPAERDLLADGIGGMVARRVRVNRSGAASMAAAVLMFVVAFSAAVDLRSPGGPFGGGAAREPAVVAAPSTSVEAPEGHTPAPTTKDVPERKPRPQRVPAPEPAPDPTVLAEPAPEVQPEQEAAAEPEPRQVDQAKQAGQADQAGQAAQAPVDTVPEVRSDLPGAQDRQVAREMPRMSEFLKPMLELYQQSMRSRDRHEFHGYQDPHKEYWGSPDRG